MPGIRKHQSPSLERQDPVLILSREHPTTIWTVSSVDYRSSCYVDISSYGLSTCIFGKLLDIITGMIQEEIWIHPHIMVNRMLICIFTDTQFVHLNICNLMMMP
jgi:hypothetical protein